MSLKLLALRMHAMYSTEGDHIDDVLSDRHGMKIGMAVGNGPQRHELALDKSFSRAVIGCQQLQLSGIQAAKQRQLRAISDCVMHAPICHTEPTFLRSH